MFDDRAGRGSTEPGGGEEVLTKHGTWECKLELVTWLRMKEMFCVFEPSHETKCVEGREVSASGVSSASNFYSPYRILASSRFSHYLQTPFILRIHPRK